jgi:hypothetical protein
MNIQKFKTPLIALVVLILLTAGIVMTSRTLSSGSQGYVEEVPWEIIPTITKFVVPNTPTKTIEPFRALFTRADCTYPPEVVMNQLVKREELEVDIWMGNQEYSKNDAIEVINSSESKIYKDLFLQLYTAKINIYLGVDASQIEIELYDAENLINKYSLEAIRTIKDLIEAVDLTDTLEDFNNGVIGPGLCDRSFLASLDAQATPIRLSLSTITPTPANTNTPTPTQTPIRTPTPLITNTPYSAGRTSTPTKTDKPDEPDPPDEPNPTVRNTRVPPTDPPPTDVPTKEPTPTLAGP